MTDRNQDRYPNNIYEPTILRVGNNNYKYYRAKFSSLYDLYNYLKSEPLINTNVFHELHSSSRDSDFAGIPYDEALEELMKPPRGDYRNFLRLSDSLNNDCTNYIQEYIEVKSPGGGYIDIPAYCSGDPLCYKTSRSIYTPKFVKLNITLSYYWGTSKEQVLNRALIVSALVNAFEQAGYIVEINTFELSHLEDELVNISVNIKNSDETFNKSSLYKTLCYVEFLRRILFRVLETIDVEYDEWQHTYGSTASESFTRKALKLDSTDIFIDQPREMGIRGNNIVDDFIHTLNNLDLEDKIDVEKAADDFRKDIKVLKKTIK